MQVLQRNFDDRPDWPAALFHRCYGVTGQAQLVCKLSLGELEFLANSAELGGAHFTHQLRLSVQNMQKSLGWRRPSPVWSNASCTDAIDAPVQSDTWR